MSLPRWLSFSAQCAQVRVTPEVSSSRVLIAGMPQAPIGVNCVREPGPAVGHCACEVRPQQLVCRPIGQIRHRELRT